MPPKINKKEISCKPDHNGECLICDCWLENCAFERWKNKDYAYETEEELNKMFDGS